MNFIRDYVEKRKQEIIESSTDGKDHRLKELDLLRYKSENVFVSIYFHGGLIENINVSFDFEGLIREIKKEMKNSKYENAIVYRLNDSGQFEQEYVHKNFD